MNVKPLVDSLPSESLTTLVSVTSVEQQFSNNIPTIQIDDYDEAIPKTSIDPDDSALKYTAPDLKGTHFVTINDGTFAHPFHPPSRLLPIDRPTYAESITLSINPTEEDLNIASDNDPPPSSSTSPPSPLDAMIWMRARSMSYGSAVPILSKKTKSSSALSRSWKNCLILICVVLGMAAVGAVIGLSMPKSSKDG
ncbi:hypothetical protein HDU97_002747 [Phlyctochytrium planicorne]|nr:hypothetical protein HDU97_002747 [Phlyctochytrium planicorne]